MLFFIKKYIYLLPPIQMLLLVVASIIEAFELYCFSENDLFNIGFNVGNSTFTLLVYFVFFFHQKLRYCLFTRWMVLGLIFNQMLYYLSFFIANEYYQKLYTITTFVVAIIGYYIYLLKDKKLE